MADQRPYPPALIFELEETLLDRRPAWRYAIEESIGVACHRRVSAAPLVDEYFGRPVGQAFAILCESTDERLRCQRVFPKLFYRSALKRLTVHDGVGMVLDSLIHAGVEVGAISRESHSDARKAIESTGIDRFLTVLSAEAASRDWRLDDRVAACLAFLEREPPQAAFVSVRGDDVAAARSFGMPAIHAGWGSEHDGEPASPRDLSPLLRQLWRPGAGAT